MFREWKVPVLDPGGAFKDYCELHKVQPLSTDLKSMDAYWLSKFVQEVVNAEGAPCVTNYSQLIKALMLKDSHSL